jgi:hypothetical protein
VQLRGCEDNCVGGPIVLRASRNVSAVVNNNNKNKQLLV